METLEGTAPSNLKLGDLLRSPAARQLLTLVGIAGSVAIGVAIVLWSRAPSFSLLYGNLADQDAAQVVQALQAAAIPYQLEDGSGAILVPANLVHDARLKLAAEGLPEQAGVGLELMQEDPGFGVSQFMENARYHHALETELARTVAKLQPVKNARVHLALAKQSAFIRDRSHSTASVLLSLHPGRRLEGDQVASIVHLVASSISELSPDQVTVIDQQGHLLSSPRDSRDYAMTATQFEHARKLEHAFAERIENLLVPLVGVGRVRAEVVADLDFTVTQSTQESYDPSTVAVRSEQRSEQERRDGRLDATGTPGAVSNQPPISGSEIAGTAETETPPVSRSSNETRNYEVDRRVSHIRQSTGDIRRLSVAVIVDDKQSVDAEGNISNTPISPQELERFTALVREAVGFVESRGDTIQVVNASFQSAAPLAEVPAAKFWELPLFRELVKQGLGAVLVLGLIFGLLRPLARGLLEPSLGQPALAGAQGGLAALPAGADADLAALTDGLQSDRAPPPSMEARMAAAREIASADPERVARVVKRWVAEDG